jgi:hypothetical protein
MSKKVLRLQHVQCEEETSLHIEDNKQAQKFKTHIYLSYVQACPWAYNKHNIFCNPFTYLIKEISVPEDFVTSFTEIP